MTRKTIWRRLVQAAAAALALAACTAAPALAAEAPWQLQNPVAPQHSFRDDLKAVCALDGGTAWVAGAGSALYYSHDGGVSWERQQTGAPCETEWRAVQFADRQHGFLAGVAGGRGLIYATADGGQTWAPRISAAGPPRSAAPALVDLDLVGANCVWALGAGGAVLASADGGLTWRRSRAGAELAAVDFTDSAHGVAVGPRGLILRTSDGGATWQRAFAAGAGLSDVVMQSATQGWAVGEQGLVLRTTDGGLSWQRQETPSGLGDCLAVDFASAARGWIALSSGELLGTEDGGCTWKLEESPGVATLRALDAPPVTDAGPLMGGSASAASAAPTPYRAFAAGDGGAVLKYTEVGTESHGNSVWLVQQTAQGNPLTLPAGMSFQLDSIVYTTNQPYDGWSTSTGSCLTPNGQWPPCFIITINVGRSNSTPPAQWFTSFCSGNEIGIGVTTTTPPNLNFAFSGTLTANGSYTIAFGQGNADGNNWWIGGPGYSIVTPMSGTYPSIATPDSAWLFSANGPNISNGNYAYSIVMSPN